MSLNRKIKLGERELTLKYTIESWKKLEEVGISPFTAEQSLAEKPGTTLSHLVYFGLSPEVRKDISQDELDASLDMKIVHTLRPILIEDCKAAPTEKKGKSTPKK